MVGKPADSLGLTAYSFEIQGNDGEGTRNALRFVGGLVALSATGGLLLMRRRVI